MINFDDAVNNCATTSYTRNNAVLYLLGLPIVRSLPEGVYLTLYDILQSEIDHAENAYDDAKDESLSEDVISEKLEAINKAKSLIPRAHQFLCDIDDELAKGAQSVLRLDQLATKNQNLPYFTFNSLNSWALNKYGDTIIDKPLFKINSSIEQQHLTHKESSDPVGSLSSVKADHLYTTFSFLLEAFADVKNSGYRRSDGGLNVEAIAKHLAFLANTSNAKSKLSGQGAEAIKDRIQYAMKIKASKLPK